jgi:hypothetical protein
MNYCAEILSYQWEEQRERLLRRLEKNTIGSSQWGFEERERWDDYVVL